jgi:hypothetical protein
MALHARRKGTNAALIYFPCCAWSLIADLPKASFCFIAISFFITLPCCLHFMNFSLMSRTESITKLYSIAQCTKFPFQRVFICPNRTLDKRVTSVLLRWWNMSWNFRTRNTQCFLHNSLHGSSNSLVLDALECQLDGDFEYLILFICTPLNKLSNWWRQQHPLRDLERLMIYLATLLGMTSLFIIRTLYSWLVKIGPFLTCTSLRSLAWPRAKHDRDLQNLL